MTGGGLIIVVGGGLAGLAAAHRLRVLGYRVTLLESGERPGGQVRTIREGGWVMDVGATTVADPGPGLDELLGAAGAADEVLRPAAGTERRYLVHHGELVGIPTSTAEMVASPLLSVAGRLRMIREPFIGRGGTPEESAAGFARRRFGEEAAARFFEPLVASTWGADPEELLAEFAFPRLVGFERRSGSILKGRLRATREAKRTGVRPAVGGWSCRGGLGTLSERMATALGEAWRPGRRVVSLALDASTVTVGCDDGSTMAADGVLLAVPAPVVGTLRIAGCDARLGSLAELPHTSLAVVALGYPRDAVAHPGDGHGVLVPPSEGHRLLSLQFTSALFPDRAPDGHLLLTATFGGTRHPGDVGLDDAALVELAGRELRELLGVQGEPVRVAIGRWPAALPLAVRGHRARLDAAAAFERASRRVGFAGSWHDGLAVGSVLQGGRDAADRLAQRLAAVPRPSAPS